MNDAQLIPAFEWRCPSCGEKTHESETCGAYGECYECGQRARLYRTSPRRSFLSVVAIGASLLMTLASLTIAAVTQYRAANQQMVPAPLFEPMTDYVEIVQFADPGRIIGRHLIRRDEAWVWRYEVFTPSDGMFETYDEDNLRTSSSIKEMYDEVANKNDEGGGEVQPGKLIFRNNFFIPGHRPNGLHKDFDGLAEATKGE